MRRIGSILAVALALVAPFGTAHGTALDYQGFAFETGGFPPSAPGDTLSIPLLVTAANPELGFDSATEELTGWVSGLVSNGPQDIGDGVLMVTYSAGRIEFYRDPSLDHAYGELPPNATAPATFTNGELCLAGNLIDFTLYIDTESNSGAYEAQVEFDTGKCLYSFKSARAEGFTFGGVITRGASGAGVMPLGYDMSVDGYLEAQKVATECPFACVAITEARLDFPRRHSARCGPRDGKFRIKGAFTPCPEGGPLDPGAVEVRLQIGDYTQVFPEGALRPERRRCHHDGEDEDEMKWEFENSRGVSTFTKLEITGDADGGWEFEIEGRGIQRSTLLRSDNLLVVELAIGHQIGEASAALVQKHQRLRYKGHGHACRPCPHAPQATPSPGAGVTVAASPSVLATPNPFNATTTIALRTAAPGDVRLCIFDVRGRRVRALQSGLLPAGEHRFVWNGTDEQGRPVSSGVYVFRVDAPEIHTSKKLVVSK